MNPDSSVVQPVVKSLYGLIYIGLIYKLISVMTTTQKFADSFLEKVSIFRTLNLLREVGVEV